MRPLVPKFDLNYVSTLYKSKCHCVIINWSCEFFFVNMLLEPVHINQRMSETNKP